MGVALANIQVFVGGKGGAAGSAGAVDLTNTGTVTTTGDHSLGLFAQSVGGGGGTGGSTSDGSNLSSLAALEASTQIGGNGNTNGNGGNVTVGNSGAIATSGNFSHGIVAQSVGGGGGQFYINFQTFNADGLPVPSQDAAIYATPGTPTTGAGGNTGGTGNSLDLNLSLGGNGGFYEYYVGVPVVTNDQKSIGAFMFLSLALSEIANPATPRGREGVR